MRTYLKNTIKPLIPETVRNAIVPVTKVQAIYTTKIVKNGQTTTDDVWIPSSYEVNPTNTNFESTGAEYSGKFTDATARKKRGSFKRWWLRTPYDADEFIDVKPDGYTDRMDADIKYYDGIALGFCT